jgi:FkbM family methyltransferase
MTIDRLLGLTRSLAIYHGIPFRQRRMRRLYSGFVQRGDIVFDVGAHAGNRARAFVALGCRTVLVEPQPDFARVLRTMFAHTRRVRVVEAAVSDAPGKLTLSISDRTPTVTTLAGAWRDARSREPDFADVRWNRTIDVDATTIDHLIAEYGIPTFVKIDVEGAESAVLAGLSHAVPALSFEYLPRALDQVTVCAKRLSALGTYRFNWSRGESYRLMERRWLTAEELVQQLPTLAAAGQPGDVFAQLAVRCHNQ